MVAQARAAGSKRIAFAIDGVITDGGLHYTDDGHELKTFNVQDGLGIKLLQRPGFAIAARAAGGHSAVCKAIEFILTAQDKPESAFAPELDPQ